MGLGIRVASQMKCEHFCSNLKLHNNTLRYNNVVSHFVRGHSLNCTFCDLICNQEEESENPPHFFFACEPVSVFNENIFSWILREPANITRQEFFVGFNRQNHRNNDALFIVSALLKKYLWDCKLRFTLPNLERGKIFITEQIKILKFVSGKSKQIFLNSDLNFQLG